MHIRPYEKLIAWQEAHTLCLSIYKITKLFPPEERYRLVSQMCRSAYSVPMNLAEGNAKRSLKEKAHFAETALASLEELHYQCVLSRDLQYLTVTQFDHLNDHIQRISYLITKLQAFLRKSPSDSSVSSASSIK